MKNSCVATALCVGAIALAFASVSCGEKDAQEISAVGRLDVPLTATSATGVKYRLRDGTFKIGGTTSARLFTESDPNAQFLRTELQEGAYSVHLKPGWFLEKQTISGTFERVHAVLTSANPVQFNIVDQETTNVRFRFKAGADVLDLGDGRLIVEIDVEESVRGCRLHADCESRACDTYAADGRGECVDPARVLYVGGGCPGSGTLADPFCRILDAAAAARATAHDVIRVMPGVHAPFYITGQQLHILGPAGEGGVASISELDTAAASVGDGANVVLDGLELGAHTGLGCSGVSRSSRAVLRRSTLQSEGTAVSAVGCEVELDRVAIQTRAGAIDFKDTHFSITNTFVGGVIMWPAAITLHGGEGTVRFSTLSPGQDPEIAPRGVIDCGSSSVLIQDSLVVGDARFADTGSHFRGACVLDRVVVGDDPIAAPGAIHETPLLQAGYRLPYTAQNLDCCIDRAPEGTLVPWDIDGTRRPQGQRADLGAYEAAAP